MNYGEMVKKELEKQGKSVYWLAKETGIPKTSIYSIIKNNARVSIHENRINQALKIGGAQEIESPHIMDDFDVAVYLSVARDTITEACKGEELSEIHINILHALDKAIYRYRRELWGETCAKLSVLENVLRGKE